MSDWIYVRDLTVRCIIGTNSWEREHRQELVLNLEIERDLSLPARTDCLDDTLNYVDLKNEIVTLAEGSRHYLIERLAQRVAETCLSREGVSSAIVTVDKPGALTGTRSVAVRIHRRREP